MAGRERPSVVAISGSFLISKRHKKANGRTTMDAMEAILTRRSVRSYTSAPIPETLLTQLLRAAMNAPSAGNEQPWHFVVIRDRAVLEAITGFHPYATMLRGAAATILVCGDLQLEKFKGFWVQDCSAATENILIAARALGLGAVWLGLHPLEERVTQMRMLLGIPDHVVPLSLVSLGYPKDEPRPADRYQASRVHHDRW
jgi:nitroreductase